MEQTAEEIVTRLTVILNCKPEELEARVRQLLASEQHLHTIQRVYDNLYPSS